MKAYTEALAHELRNTEGHQLTAHLLVPGFVFTGMIPLAEKPAAAWTPEQTVEFFLNAMNNGSCASSILFSMDSTIPWPEIWGLGHCVRIMMCRARPMRNELPGPLAI